MSGNSKDSMNRSSQSLDYCKCRCNIPSYVPYNGYCDRYSTSNHSNPMPQTLAQTTTTHTARPMAFNHTSDKDDMINRFKNLYTTCNPETDGNYEYYDKELDDDKDSPALSDGTDLASNEDNTFESGDYLEGLHCSACDKPLLVYTNLDFKLFDNWINYVFFHKSFSKSHENISHSPNLGPTKSVDYEYEEKPMVSTDSLESANSSLNSNTNSSDTTYPETNAVEYTQDYAAEYHDTWPDDDIRSIGDITSSILMSSEETMFSIINNISPGEKCTNEKNQLFDSVKRFLQYCLGEDTIVHLTGSTAYDIDIDYSDGTSASCYSDLDIVLLTNTFGGDQRVILQKVYTELVNMQHVLKERNKCPIWVLADSNIKLVESAKVPIVIIETKNGLLCDISVNTLYPLLHTELFKSYIDEHPMVRPLMRIIKHWLIVRGLPTMKEGGFPSILWMSLFCNSLDSTAINLLASSLEITGNKEEKENSEEKEDKEFHNSNEQSVDSNEENEFEGSGDLEEYKFTYSNDSNPISGSELNNDPNSFESDCNYDYKAYSDEFKSYKDEEYEEDEEEYEELNLSETYRDLYSVDYGNTYGFSIGQLWERLQGSREEYGILCSLEKCFVNLSRGLSMMDIVNRFVHIKNGSDYGGMSLFCKNIIRLIEMEPNVPFGTWLVYYYELNRAKEYMSLYSKRLEMLVTLLAFLRLLCNNTTTMEHFKALATNIQHTFGYDLTLSTTGSNRDDYNSLYVNNHYNFGSTAPTTRDASNTNSVSEFSTANASPGPLKQSFIEVFKRDRKESKESVRDAETREFYEMVHSYINSISMMLKIQLCNTDLVNNIKLLIYHMFQQFKSIPNEIFEKVQGSFYSIPVAIEPPTPIDEETDQYGYRSFECGLWDDSGWYIVVLHNRLSIVKVIKICIEWEFWWSKEFVSRRDSRSIFHGFVYRQLRLDDLRKQSNFSPFSNYSVNSPSILIKRGSLVLFNPCDIVSRLRVLKVVKHEQYISPSLYSTDFYTGVKCLYVLPGFEVDRFICFEQISHKLKHYIECRPHVTFCKLCGIVNVKKIGPYSDYKIPQRKLRNAKYVLCNPKYTHVYNLIQYRHQSLH